MVQVINEVSTDYLYEILSKGVLDIGFNVEMTKADGLALEMVFDSVARPYSYVAEIGSWKGCSTAILANKVAQKQGRLFCVDHWEGNIGVETHDVAKSKDIFALFRKNMMALGFWHVINPLVMSSEMAARIIADHTFDMVFIDADHRFESVRNDIQFWLHKVKRGGVLCGHDCEERYDKLPEALRKRVDQNLDKDTINTVGLDNAINRLTSGKVSQVVEEGIAGHNPLNLFKEGYHPGVIRAVHDVFGGRYSIIEGSNVWAYYKI